MVPLLLAFLLFGQTSAKTNDFDELVDRIVGHVDNIVHFFGYDHFDIPAINKTFVKKLSFVDVKAGLFCEKGSVDITLFKRWGPAQGNVSDGSFTYAMSLDLPEMNAEIGPCKFTMSDGFDVDGHYKALVNATAVGLGIRVHQEGKTCSLQVTGISLDIGGVYIYSGASFTHALQDWTFDAVSHMLRDTIVEKSNESIDNFVKQLPLDLVSFPCFKPIQG